MSGVGTLITPDGTPESENSEEPHDSDQAAPSQVNRAASIGDEPFEFTGPGMEAEMADPFGGNIFRLPPVLPATPAQRVVPFHIHIDRVQHLHRVDTPLRRGFQPVGIAMPAQRGNGFEEEVVAGA